MPPPLQISIPSTSTSSTPTSKPYTLYHILLTLPLRTHSLEKRYSDFTALHAHLLTETGQAPPHPLPPKSWLRSTVASPALTSARRAGLETFLRAILDADDGRWRAAPAFRAFLALPEGREGGARGEAPLDAQGWLGAHRELKGHVHSARLALRKREVQGTTVAEQRAAVVEAKGELVRAAAGIARCEGALKGMDVGEGEIRRRRDLVVGARKEVEGLERVMKGLVVGGGHAAGAAAGTGGGVASASDKVALWQGTSAGSAVKTSGRVLGAKETERTKELDNAGVLQLQKQVMQEQEEDVMEIGKAVSRMKEMGIMINEELVVQNQMLGMLDQDVDRLQGKLEVGKKRIAKIH